MRSLRQSAKMKFTKVETARLRAYKWQN